MTEWQDPADIHWSSGGPVEFEIEDGVTIRGYLYVEDFQDEDGEDQPSPVFENEAHEEVYGVKRYRPLNRNSR